MRCATKRIELPSRWVLPFNTTKTEGALFTCRRDHTKLIRQKLTAKIKVRNGYIQFNKHAPHWLGIWMEAHLRFKQHYNRCIKKARAAEARLRTLTETHGVTPESVRAVDVVCIQVVTLYGSELWWDPKEVGSWDDLQLLLNRQAKSVLGVPATTPRAALMRESGLTPAPVILDSRQQQFTARVANAWSSKLKELQEDSLSGTPICQVVKTFHEHSQTTKCMSWPALGEKPVVWTIILENKSIAKSAAQCWAGEKEAKVGAGHWMWCTDRSCSDDGPVGAAAVCKHGNEWRTCRSGLGTGHIQSFDAELWAIGLTLWETVQRREWLQEYGVKMVTVFSNSQAAIWQTAHLEAGHVQWLAMQINRTAQALLSYGIATEIHLVPGYFCLTGNNEAERQATLARDASGDTVREQPYTSASNRARRISEGRLAAKAKWEAKKCSKHISYRLKGTTGTKRPVLMTSMK